MKQAITSAKNRHIIPARLLSTQVDAGIRNVGLDLARGICVLLVVLAHTNNLLRDYIPIYRLIYPLGEMAQDLFFSLSGYLIGAQILRMTSSSSYGKKELFVFYKKRWIRTIPFYLLFLVINLILFYLVYQRVGPYFLRENFNPLPYFVFLQNFAGRPPVFFPEIWPIPIEEWSYLLLPLPFLFFKNFFGGGNPFYRRLGYLSGLIIAVQAIRMIYITAHHPETDWELRKIVVYRFDALAYGFILAALMQVPKSKDRLAANRRLLCASGLVLLGASLLFNKVFSRDHYNMLLFFYQPFACTLVLPVFIFGTFKPGSITAMLTHFSLTGYAILLSHLYCLQFLFITFFQVNTLLAALLITLVYLAVLLGVSTMFYNYVERPVLLMRKE
jgi:peptidoglycan/LPS O-acetylase OafA/YrhL